jgi:hypothetical protein
MSCESTETIPTVASTSDSSNKWSPNYGYGGSMKVEIKSFDEKINFWLMAKADAWRSYSTKIASCLRR